MTTLVVTLVIVGVLVLTPLADRPRVPQPVLFIVFGAGEGYGDATVERLESVLRRASEIEREVVLRARSLGEVSAAVTDEVLQDVEAGADRDAG